MYCQLCGCFLVSVPDDGNTVCSDCRDSFSEEDVADCRKTSSRHPLYDDPSNDEYPGWEEPLCIFCKTRDCGKKIKSEWVCDHCESVYKLLLECPACGFQHPHDWFNDGSVVDSQSPVLPGHCPDCLRLPCSCPELPF